MSESDKPTPCSSAVVCTTAPPISSATKFPQPSPAEVGKGEWNPRAFLFSLMIPSFMMMISTSMIRIALPAIRDSLGARVDLVAWVITIYTLPYVILMPLYGRLGDALGKQRLFLTGIVTFLLGTCVNLLATDFRLLLVGRVIQGIGAAGIVPLAIAIISERFPVTERGKALGTWNSIGPFTHMVGPLLAGLLIEVFNWRMIFVPVLLAAIVAFPAVQRRVPAARGKVQPGFLHRFDWGGVALLSVAMTTFFLYISSEHITGVAALRDWRLLALALFLFGGFVLWEKGRADPFVNLDIFAHRTFSQASLSAGARMFGLSSISFLTPLYLTDVHRLRAASIGLIVPLHSASLLATMRLGGQIADRWGSRWPVVAGMGVQAGSMVYFALLPGTASVGLVVFGLVIHGLGAGLSLAALHRAALGQIPQTQMGVAAGIYSMIRFSGTALSAALGGVILQQALDQAHAPVHAYQVVFWVTAGVVLTGMLIGLRLKE